MVNAVEYNAPIDIGKPLDLIFEFRDNDTDQKLDISGWQFSLQVWAVDNSSLIYTTTGMQQSNGVFFYRFDRAYVETYMSIPGYYRYEVRVWNDVSFNDLYIYGKLKN